MFLLVWVGSVVALLATAVMATWRPGGVERALVWVAAVAYVLGVQLPTGGVNVPLNNRLKSIDTTETTEAERTRVLQDFEARWNRWNAFRTVCACTVSLLLALVLLRT